MPIYQPTQTLIHTDDFRDNIYSFAVESVITTQERIGMLTVSASAGYLLTTSLNRELKREQAFDHVQQDDGSWLATGTVTLYVTGDLPVNGTIVVRNSLGEKTVLTINITSTAIAQLQRPALLISQSALTFPQTTPGKPSFVVLTVAQQHSEVPIILTTDAPEHFQLASDSRPTFLPTLTLTPSPTGTHVHVRYTASRNGFHSGQLTIHNTYEKKIVELEGRSAGFLPTIQNPLASVRQVTLQLPKRPSGLKRQVVVLLAIATISGLSYAGYVDRCQLFPALCPDTETSQVKALNNPPVLSSVDEASKKIVLNTVTAKRLKVKEAENPVREHSIQTPTPSVNPPAKQITSDMANPERSVETEALKSDAQKKPDKQEYVNPPERQTPQRTIPTTPTAESELERLLNQKP